MSIFDKSEEQQMLADGVARLLMDTGYPEARNDILSGRKADATAALTDMGFLGATLPESFGGAGLGITDVVPALVESGRLGGLEPVTGPLLAGLALTLLSEGGSLSLPEGVPMALALADAEQPDQLPMVLDADENCALLVATQGDDGQDKLYLIAPGAVRVKAYHLPDGRRAADVTLTGADMSSAPHVTLAKGSAARLHDMAATLLCADALGAFQTMCDLTRDYLDTREQFGQPLSSHQVLQHALVDAFHEIEHVQSLLHLATQSCATDDDDRLRARSVSALKRMVGQRLRAAGASTIQMHGGIGMTDEYALGHYMKRILVADMLFGSSDTHARRIAEQIKIEAKANPFADLEASLT
ncbi:acyl-CoA dehydrogenase family protein [Mameliella alba]|nr:acyl-CoA dehydrogenase family protein [Mameliella alba]MBY6170490.1 acyl-CoA dehydrogenase family protein [Mameliella alba]MBY6175508.1 acyl-CoA dehydrogenase family protein [Mameliella alba]